MTTTALERVRGLAKEATAGDFTVYAEFNVMAGDGYSAMNLSSSHMDAYARNTANTAFLAAAANFVRSDEFDALVRDAMRYRWLFHESERVDPLAAVVWHPNGRNTSEWVNTSNLSRQIDAERGEES